MSTESPPAIIVSEEDRKHPLSPAMLAEKYIRPLIQAAAQYGFKSIIISNDGPHRLTYLSKNPKLYFTSSCHLKIIDYPLPLTEKNIVEVLEKSGLQVVLIDREKATDHRTTMIISWGNAAEIFKLNAIFYNIASKLLKNRKTVEIILPLNQPGQVNFLDDLNQNSRLTEYLRQPEDYQLDLNLLIDHRHILGYDVSYRLDDHNHNNIVVTVTAEVADKIIPYNWSPTF